MSFTTALPPFVLHPSCTRPLDSKSALTVLNTFLHLASLDPAYCPDSTLTGRGLASNSSTTNPNLTLHHLHRIKLGLDGTHLGAEDLDAAFFTEETGDGFSEEEGRGGKGGRWGEGLGRKRSWRENGDSRDQAGIPKLVSNMSPEGRLDIDDDAGVASRNEKKQKTTNAIVASNVSDEGWQDRGEFEWNQDEDDIDLYNGLRQPATANGLADSGRDILEGETGRVIDLDEELGRDDGAAKMISTGDLVDASRAERKEKKETKKKKVEKMKEKEKEAEHVAEPVDITVLASTKRALSEPEKIHKRKSKKARMENEDKSAGPESLDTVRQETNELPQRRHDAGVNSTDAAKPDDVTPIPKRRKKKFKIGE